MDTQYTFDNGPINPPTSLVFGPEYLAAKLYQLSPPEVTYSILSFRMSKSLFVYLFENYYYYYF